MLGAVHCSAEDSLPLPTALRGGKPDRALCRHFAMSPDISVSSELSVAECRTGGMGPHHGVPGPLSLVAGATDLQSGRTSNVGKAKVENCQHYECNGPLHCHLETPSSV